MKKNIHLVEKFKDTPSNRENREKIVVMQNLSHSLSKEEIKNKMKIVPSWKEIDQRIEIKEKSTKKTYLRYGKDLPLINEQTQA